MRTLDDIIPPSRRSNPSPAEPPSSTPQNSPRRSRFPYGLAGVVLVIIGICVGALYYFSSAEIQITPTSASASVSGPFTAGGDSALPYEILTSEKVATQTVAGSGTRTVTASAQGKITISNAQSVAQKLITNTRFATASGLIFRIHGAVSIPAKGTAVVTVYADQPGSQYNVGPTSFTLPGLSGTAQYTQVNAKSTVSMTGGASGNEPVVSADIESAARAALMKALEPDLKTALAAQVPKGYVLLSGATEVSYQPMPSTPGSESGKVDLKEQGTIRGIIFKNQALAAAIATASLQSTYHGELVALGSSDGLTLTAPNGIPATNDNPISITLVGTAQIIWDVDTSRIASSVTGKSRDDAAITLKSFPDVHGIKIILRPFWRNTFPEDPSGIKVQVLPASPN